MMNKLMSISSVRSLLNNMAEPAECTNIEKLFDELQASSNNLLQKLHAIKKEADTLVAVINEIKESQTDTTKTLQSLDAKLVSIQKTLDAVKR